MFEKQSWHFGSRPSDHYFCSVGWFVCLFVCLFVCAEFFSAVFDRFRSNLDICYVSGSSCVPLELYRGCATPWGWVTPKNLYFRRLKKLSRPTVLIGLSWCLVILYNAPILKFSRAIFAISVLNPNYDVINDVISGFAKVVVERCGFHHWIAQRISCDEVVSVFLYLL